MALNVLIRVLQCVTVRCRVLHLHNGVGDSLDLVDVRVAVCCSVLQGVAEGCSVLQCVAVCCSVLQCVAMRCSVLHVRAACCSLLHRHSGVGDSLKYIDMSVAVCHSGLQCVTPA